MNISGFRLKEIRLANHLKQKEMAKKLGITPSYVSKIEKEKIFPVSENLIRSICSTFNINRDWLLTGESSPSHSSNQIIAEPQQAYSASDPNTELLKKTREILESRWYTHLNVEHLFSAAGPVLMDYENAVMDSPSTE